MSQNQIPVTVIGGYLGAGKTTLLNNILRNNVGMRFAVLVNDFGSINIDAELIENQDGDTINLANGCICCSLSAGFGAAMLAIRDRKVPPEQVIIEASGVADPFKIAQYAHLPGFQLDSVIVLADAESIQKRATDKYVGRQVVQQLQSADLLLLNKIDLVSVEKRVQVRVWLHNLVSGIRVLEVNQGQVPVGLLFGDELPRRLALPEDTHDDCHEHEHHHEHDYATWSYSGEEPLNGARLRNWIAGLNSNVLRGKGFLYLAEDPFRRFVFQLVGKRWSIVPGEAWGQRKRKSRLVFIGLPGSLDGALLDTALRTCIGPDEPELVGGTSL